MPFPDVWLLQFLTLQKVNFIKNLGTKRRRVLILQVCFQGCFYNKHFFKVMLQQSEVKGQAEDDTNLLLMKLE